MPFGLQSIIMEAMGLYKHEAQRKDLDFELDLSGSQRIVVGDSSKIKTVVVDLTANAHHASSVKYMQRGSIAASCHAFNEPEGLRDAKSSATVVARSVEQLGGQLRVDSQVDQGSRFSYLIPFTLWDGRGRPRDSQHGQREASTPVPVPSPSPSVLCSDPVLCEHEAPSAVVDRSVSSSPRQGVVPAVPVASNSQALP
ncbi:hypothetical protein BJV78DRAFT_1283165 [Lactifluus subvellereus]|nr:hypothetical protein BJV78DRAFT_1283165 [Lactifluus subvellereus]